MSAEAHLDPTVRHDMVFLFDVADGNPNGDPDVDNQPRMDDVSSHGLVTDVALKRKVRDTLPLAAGDTGRHNLFVEAGHALNTRLGESLHANGIPVDANKKKLTDEQRRAARQWLCDRYFDIRLFGAVLSTGDTKALGQIYGPLQVTNARSIEPITPQIHTITRVTQTTQQDIDEGQTNEMGNKWTVPYGLYCAEIYYSANRAGQTGVDTQDLALLYRTLEMMFDHDRSATRGTMTARGLHVFSHNDAFGNAPAHKLTERVQVARTDPNSPEPARRFSDYTVSVDDDGLPDGVTYSKIIS